MKELRCMMKSVPEFWQSRHCRLVYVTYRKVSVADEKMTCRQEAGWYRGIDMIVPLHVLCEGIFLCHVASDRARRPNVPENILYAQIRVHKLKQYQDKKQQK